MPSRIKKTKRGVDVNDIKKIFSCEVAHTHRFACIMKRPNTDDLSSEAIEEINYISLLFQACVNRVYLEATPHETKINISLYNILDPKSKRMLLSQIRALIDNEARTHITIFNMNEAGRILSEEQYVVSVTKMSIVRDHNCEHLQCIDIEGVVESELVAE